MHACMYTSTAVNIIWFEILILILNQQDYGLVNSILWCLEVFVCNIKILMYTCITIE